MRIFWLGGMAVGRLLVVALRGEIFKLDSLRLLFSPALMLDVLAVLGYVDWEDGGFGGGGVCEDVVRKGFTYCGRHPCGCGGGSSVGPLLCQRRDRGLIFGGTNVASGRCLDARNMTLLSSRGNERAVDVAKKERITSEDVKTRSAASRS